MSTQAELITICPFALAKKLDILNYAPDYYTDIHDDDEILTTLLHIRTSCYYVDVCSVLGVSKYKPGKQEVLFSSFPDESYAHFYSHNDSELAELQATHNCVAELLHNNCRVFLKVDF